MALSSVSILAGERGSEGGARCDRARRAGTGSAGDGHVGRQAVCEFNTKPSTPWQRHTRVTCFIDCGSAQSISSLTFRLRPPSQRFAFTAAQLPKGRVFPSAAFQKLQRTDVFSRSEFSAGQRVLLGGCQPPQSSGERGFCPPTPHSRTLWVPLVRSLGQFHVSQTQMVTVPCPALTTTAAPGARDRG